MRVHATDLPGVTLIDPAYSEDERGIFVKWWDESLASDVGLAAPISQVAHSYNRLQGTLRGLHFQRAPFAEAKYVTCVQGAVFDVVVDLRWGTATFQQWLSFELRADDQQLLYIPPGCAHGFVTLTPDAELVYLIVGAYQPAYQAGVRWNDPQLAIPWPIAPACMSARDRSLPYLKDLPPDWLKLS